MNNNKSAKQYMLQALIPYTKANMELSFRPSRFFAELERRDRINSKTIRTAYYRAVQKKLIVIDESGLPTVTDKGKRELLPFTAKKLKGSRLMIVFDIPEIDRWKRTHLRHLLKDLSFKQVQKSVWVTEYNHRELLEVEVGELGLGKSIRLFEAREIK